MGGALRFFTEVEDDSNERMKKRSPTPSQSCLHEVGLPTLETSQRKGVFFLFVPYELGFLES